jgi:hypothetical protein
MVFTIDNDRMVFTIDNDMPMAWPTMYKLAWHHANKVARNIVMVRDQYNREVIAFVV